MPDDAPERRHHLNRQDYAERFARGDSYGLLLALLVVLYIVIAAENHESLWGRFFVSVILGGVLLLDFLYFSFVTITTVGYGDLTAGTSTGRVLVTFEALIGQIFLVTLVARLVSMYGVSRRPARAGPDDDSGVEE